MKVASLGFACAMGLLPGFALAVETYPQVAVPLANALPTDPGAPVADWHTATSMSLTWDEVRSRPASEPATADILTDGHALYVRFDAQQREPIAASQHTNDVGQGSDDAVWVDLWPNGLSGISISSWPRPTARTTSPRKTPASRRNGNRPALRTPAATP